MNPTISKDANMEVTVVARMLDLVQEELAKRNPCFSLPKTLIVNADNTPREAKNTFFHTFMSALTSANTFDTTQVEFFKVGHTHNEQDQRFSTVGSSLALAPVLEGPEEFVEWIRSHVTPVRGRRLHVEIIHRTMDSRNSTLRLAFTCRG